MEAQMANLTQRISSSRIRFRTGLILGGIVVAVIVSSFLMQDTNFETGFSILPHLPSTTKQIVQQSTNLSLEKFTTAIDYLFN